MKPIPEVCSKREGGRSWMFRPALFAAAILLAAAPAGAAISEPDALVYGAIVIGNTTITATRTDVVVEARRAANGPAVVTYRMGSEAPYGDYYAFRLRVQSVLPLDDPEAFRVGDTVFLAATDGDGATAQGSFIINDRGEAQRVDLGQATADSDNDGLPDAWEIAQFGNLNLGPISTCPNGQPAMVNFIAGNNPNQAGSGFSLKVENSGEIQQVSFLALRAQGAGYEGRQRFYALEWSKDPFPPFTVVGDLGKIPGNDQTITFDVPQTNALGFFRGKVWLE